MPMTLHLETPSPRLLSRPGWLHRYVLDFCRCRLGTDIRVQQPQLPSINQPFDPRASLDANSLLDSRRSSVDSRVGMGLGHLQISPSSPYDSQNASRASLVSNLREQRGITDSRANGSGGPLSPLGQRNSGGLKPQVAPRVAPVINPNPRSVSGMPDPTAAAPTKGFPWAFPDQDEHDDQRRSSSASSIEQRPSRQNSFATASSIFTVDSALPHGQKRFSEGKAAPGAFLAELSC
jgi:hypothetical protein